MVHTKPLSHLLYRVITLSDLRGGVDLELIGITNLT